MKKLVIFDCDGVLVDSEIIASRLVAEILTNLGHPFTAEDCNRRFTGVDDKTMRRILLDEYKVDITKHLSEEDLIKVLENDLTSLMIPVLQTLKNQHINRCVASNSQRERVIRSLELTNQFQFFTSASVFTVEQVKQGKPAPDLFLLAAEKMGYQPVDCLVIEDSLAGIRAALDANMDVIAFLGGGHAGFDWYKERIQAHHIPIAHNVQEVSQMIEKYLRKTA